MISQDSGFVVGSVFKDFESLRLSCFRVQFGLIVHSTNFRGIRRGSGIPLFGLGARVCAKPSHRSSVFCIVITDYGTFWNSPAILWVLELLPSFCFDSKILALHGPSCCLCR